MMKNYLKRLQSTALLLALTFLGLNLSAQSGWQQVYTGSGWIDLITFVPGSDNQWKTGWAVTAQDEIIKTTDGGDTWAVYPQYIATWTNGIAFLDENTGFMSSANGQIVKSTDGGETWSMIYENSSEWFGQMSFKDNMNGVIVGNPGKYTSDGGATWTNNTSEADLDRVDYGGGDTYFAAGFLAMEIAKSTDNGANFADNYFTGELLDVITAFDADHAMTGGTAAHLIFTQDGGESWQNAYLNTDLPSITSAGYFDLDTAYVAVSGSYIYKTTDGFNSWTQDTAITGVIHKAMFVTPTNVVYLGGDPTQIWRKIGPTPLSPGFIADQTVICSGSTVNYTDQSIGQNISSWSWSFPGGTPSTSIDQNPSVVYNSDGVYNVTLTITDDNGTDTETKYDYISVLGTPAKADAPNGETEICNAVFSVYTTNEVLYALNYEWELSPADAGTLTVDGLEATLEADQDWSGDFTLKVRATNNCGFGDWSDNFEGTINENPDEFTLEGGGTFCEGSDGVEITLNGSETGVEYELFLDGISAGITIDGTGSELSFGLVNVEGYYTSEGTNGTCSIPMTEQVMVEMSGLPTQPSAPTGPVAICTETSSDYTSAGGDDSDVYAWILFPSDAGTISGTGLVATVSWNDTYSGLATISLYGVNDCGDGETSEELEVSVGAPAPIIEGEDMVCDFSSEIYSVTDNEGSAYAWIVSGGEIVEGEATSMVTVAWTGEGNGTIMVTEETADGCEGSSEQFDVLIDDCTGISDNLADNEIGIYPNPATDALNIKYNSDSEQKFTAEVYNNIGQIVLSEKIQAVDGNQTHSIDISELNDGLYILKINADKNLVASERFIKN